MKSKLIQALEDYASGKKVETFGSTKSAIEYDPIFIKLKRIFNNGHGLLSFAEMDEKLLLINSFLCSKKEIKDINDNLKIAFEFVGLGYPDYYQHGLASLRRKKLIENEN